MRACVNPHVFLHSSIHIQICTPAFVCRCIPTRFSFACLALWPYLQCCYVCTLPMALRPFVSYCFEYICLVNACRHTRCSCPVCLQPVLVYLFIVHDRTHACSLINGCMLLTTYYLQKTKNNANDRCRYRAKVPYALINTWTRVPFARVR